MIIPKHRACDICKQYIYHNIPYITIKRKCLWGLWAGSAGSFKENSKVDICYDCWNKVTRQIADEIDCSDKEE